MHDVIWDDIKIFESVNHSFNGFLQNYISLLNECFPKIKTKLNSQKHFCPWITEAGSQRGHWESWIYISTDMFLDLTTIQYCYTKLLAPRLHKSVPKCKKNDKLQCCYYEKLKWGLLMSLQWLSLFCEQWINALALYTNNAIKCHINT